MFIYLLLDYNKCIQATAFYFEMISLDHYNWLIINYTKLLCSFLMKCFLCMCFLPLQTWLFASGWARPVPAADSCISSYCCSNASQPRVVRYNVLLALWLPLPPSPLSCPATCSYIWPWQPLSLHTAWAWREHCA